MKKSSLKTVICLLVVMVMLASLAACGTKAPASTEGSSASKETTAEVKKEPVKITYATYRCGTHNAAVPEKKIQDAFNEKFGNEIICTVEELPSDQAYVDKMKILAGSGELPDVTEGKTGLLELISSGGGAEELTDRLAKDPEFKSEIGDDAINANLINGKLYSISNGSLVIGYFYNKEMFEKAAIKPAETWDEFMTNCEKLKAAGFTPLSMGTAENAWTVNLILSSFIGTSGPEGNKFVNEKYPKSYETPEMIAGLKYVQTLLKNYTTKDALGGPYATAANNFCQGKTAMIANGPWMIGDFSDKTKSIEGFAEKVGVAAYPGGGLFKTFEQGFMLTAKTPETKEAAWTFLKFKTGLYAQQVWLEHQNIAPLTSKLNMSDEYKKANPLAAQLFEQLKTCKYSYKYFDVISYPNVIDSFKLIYPELVFDKTTPEKAAKTLTDAAAKNK